MPTFNSQTLSVTIDRPWTQVYDYAADPANLSHWAAGLGSGFDRSGDKWIFHDPSGKPVSMTFAADNPFGVLDHDVFVGDQVVHMAVRVMPNGDGAEVTILVLQLPGMDDAAFERDQAAVRKDLEKLKSLLEA
jgi:uncharacterized membrane protein